MSAPVRTFTVRHVQLLRALFAAAAALMITFSPDHSAQVGFAVFGGFATASAFVFILGAWLAVPAGSRWPFIVLAVINLLGAAVGGAPTWRTDGMFFIVIIVWAAATGIVELIVGLRTRGSDPLAKDAVTTGALGLILAVILLLIPVGYTQVYAVEGAGEMTLTGIILAVGLFGGYAAIVAVFLAIAGLSPRREQPVTAEGADEDVTPAQVETGGTA